MRNLVLELQQASRNVARIRRYMRQVLVIAAVEVLVGLALVAALAAGESRTGQVTRIIDGDTLVVAHNGRQETVRVAGIDCPELSQPFGDQARRAAERLVLGKEVRLEVRAIGYYGRTIARVTLPNGRDLAEELVRDGLAWARARVYRDAEASAKGAKLGLWSGPKPTAPWEWRNRKSLIRELNWYPDYGRTSRNKRLAYFVNHPFIQSKIRAFGLTRIHKRFYFIHSELCPLNKDLTHACFVSIQGSQVLSQYRTSNIYFFIILGSTMKEEGGRGGSVSSLASQKNNISNGINASDVMSGELYRQGSQFVIDGETRYNIPPPTADVKADLLTTLGNISSANIKQFLGACWVNRRKGRKEGNIQFIWHLNSLLDSIALGNGERVEGHR